MKNIKKYFLLLVTIGSVTINTYGRDIITGVGSAKGPRSTQEDTHMHYHQDNVQIFGVFDGHGGSDCSEYVAQNNRMAEQIVTSDAFMQGNMQQALETAFRALDDEYCSLAGRRKPEFIKYFPEGQGITNDDLTKACREQAGIQNPTFRDRSQMLERITYKNCGTTAVVAVINSDDNLYIANAGDARAVIARANGQAERLSHDHKPGNPEEQERINLLGGKVVDAGYFDYDEVETREIWHPLWRVNGQISVSRAIGDKSFKPYLTAEPFIKSTHIEPNDQFLILGCDGLWDVMSDQQAVDFVKKTIEAMNITLAEITEPHAQKIIQALIDEAVNNDKQTDNVTVQLVIFSPIKE